MKISYSWLCEWVRAPWPARELGERLTLAGFELESLEAAAPEFSGVVVAEILEAQPHPQAQKLQICRVASGAGEPLQIVCGAPNARAHLKCALATVGARLPGGVKIRTAKLRGVASAGMLCSAKELGLADSSTGILELPPEAPLGRPLREYLQLDDAVLDLNITPNRGDAMSVLGIAREVAALGAEALTGPAIEPVAAGGEEPAGARVARRAGRPGAAGDETPPVAAGGGDRFPVRLDAPAACPRFAGRVIRGVDNRAPTPLWMRERLRRAGLRGISPIVDVTNYILLELGQPMHAYDLARLRGGIHVRSAAAGESLTLLDGRGVKLDTDMLVIADDAGAVGLAGIMGGERTAVSDGTVDVFLEVAYFTPDAITGRARRVGLQTDASQRFERGVDPAGQQRALERATALIVSIAGGTPGPSELTEAAGFSAQRAAVELRRPQLARLLGTAVADERVEGVLKALQMQVVRSAAGWQVTPPSYRFDIAIEADLIEEVARVIGYDAIPEADAAMAQRFTALPEGRAPERTVLDSLAARGYHETISFAFVDPELQARLFPDRAGLALANPIASDLSVMRVSLWPGLLRAAAENQRRQQERIRLFEHGTRFVVEADGVAAVREIDSLAGLALGARLPEQWGVAREANVPVDFFDVKADVETLIEATGDPAAFAFEAASLACLHPGRAARVLRGGQNVGWIGELHPSLVAELGFTHPPILFELDFVTALRVELPRLGSVSRFPYARRDIAVIVDDSVSFSALRERVTLAASSLLRDLRIFDVYRGSGVEIGRKSVALGLIFHDISRTLTDDDVDRAVASVVADLRTSLGARIRE